MTTLPLDAAALPAGETPPARLRLRDRLCTRMGGLCRLLRLSHDARVPF